MICAAVLASGCQRTPPAATEPASAAPASGKAAGEPMRDPLTISVDETTSRRLRVEPVSTRSMTETIRLAGRLDLNEYRTARIGAPIPGRIVDVNVAIGDSVRQGQTLAELASPELAQAQLDFVRASSQQRMMASAVDRARTLLEADVIGSVELQRRQNEYQVASAERHAAADRLRSLGMTPRQLQALESTGAIQPKTTIGASLTGTVIERNVTRGQAVALSDTVFVVSDLDHLWGLAEVPEQDARFVVKGQRVVIEIPALGGQPVAGKVAFVADVVNPATRTVRIGVDLDNRERRLKPLMLMTMLETGQDRFRLTPVELGFEHDGLRTLTTRLPEETRIVVDGAFHLNNLRNQRALAGR